MKRSIIKKLACLLLAAMMLSLAACSNADPTKPTDPNAGINSAPAGERVMQLSVRASANGKKRQADEAFCAAQTGFAVELFKSALKKGENSLVSPLSVMLALAMTANGADGETLGEMEKVLGMPIDRLNEYLHTYIENLPTAEKYKVLISNSIWFRASEEEFTPNVDCEPFFSPNPEFMQNNADYYGAEIYASPFDESTVEAINEWVKKNTDGMIEHILDRIDPYAVMYLANTLMFDAEWANIYYEHEVSDGVFHALNGSARDAKMMSSTEYTFIDGGDAVGFVKPYSGNKYGFAVLLPNEGVNINDYVASLTGEKLLSILDGAQSGTVYAKMPKFSFDYDITLNDALSAMGMPTAFNAIDADFSRIGHCFDDSNIYIGRVIHKTHIEVGEKGTRAGAATLVEFLFGSAMPTNVHEVTLDRPFVFSIIDMETNLPLFIGTVTDIG